MVNFQKTIYEYKLFRKRISRLNSLVYILVNTYTHILIAINIVYPFYILNASFFPLCIICYYLLLSSPGYSNSLRNVSQFQCILQTVYESDPSKAQILLKLSKHLSSQTTSTTLTPLILQGSQVPKLLGPRR